MRWWDGEDWTGRRSLLPRRASLAPLGPRFARLADLLGLLLLVNAGFSLLTVAVETVEPIKVISRVLALLSIALMLVTAVFWCAWQWRLAVSSPDQLRRSPRGHVGAWFIPIANIWLPIQNLNELWYAYEPFDPRGRGRGTSVVLPWWTCWTISAVLGALGLHTLLGGDTPGAYLGVAWAMAAVLARVVVRRLSWRALVYHADLD
jgi:hypothetical protein